LSATAQLTKLAEQQSCYSGPKKNLIEDRTKEKERPTKKSKRKLHWTKLWEEEIDLVVQLNQVPTKEELKGYTLSLKGMI